MEIKWVGLGYSVPAIPSKNRVYIWRKLKGYGAEYFRQGVAVLPNTCENVDSLRSLSEKIRNMDGGSSLIEFKFLDKKDELEMLAKFKKNPNSGLSYEIENAIKEILGGLKESADDFSEEIKKLWDGD